VSHPLRIAIARSRRALLFGAVFSFISNLLFLTTSLYMMQVYDRVLTTRSLDTLVYLTLMALIAMVAFGLLDLARAKLLVNVSTYLEERTAPEAFERSLSNSLEGLRYRSEVLRDVREVRGFLTGQGIIAIFDLPWTPLFLVAIFFLNPLLGAFSTVAMLLLFSLAVTNDRLSRANLVRASEVGVSAMQDLETCNRNAEIIDALGMLPAVAQRWLKKNTEALQLNAKASSTSAAILAFSKFCRLGVQILILAVGAWLVMQDSLTGGGMVAASIILVRALAPVDMAIGTWKQFVSARMAYRRIDDTFKRPQRRPAGMRLPPPSGILAVEQVSFAIAGRRAILDEVSFELPAGETLAILGPSAAGKTTLGRMLIGILPPSSGHIRLDGADIFPWNRDELGRHVGYLPQEVSLFAGTVAENIARLRDFDPDEVIEAAQRANVHDMILRLPKGYDTDIGERGLGLSGGQRQRVALARALFGRPSLVVLDEPNANLDSEGDAGLVRALAELRSTNTTVVFITHRPGLIAYADKLLLLRDGLAEIFGPRQDVLARLKPHSVSPEPVGRVGMSEPIALRRQRQ
jgi:ATP-binding cassette, subfamily C, type I secretion system permease/ATPase